VRYNDLARETHSCEKEEKFIILKRIFEYCKNTFVNYTKHDKTTACHHIQDKLDVVQIGNEGTPDDLHIAARMVKQTS
jgi:hypothetical protein